eukprot:gene2726-3921_t
MVIKNPPRISKTPGDVCWKQLKYDQKKLICLQEYGIFGSFGKTFRILIKKEDAPTFRVITTFEPYLELAVSESFDDILKDYFTVESILPKKFSSKNKELAEEIKSNLKNMNIDKPIEDKEEEDYKLCTVCFVNEKNIALNCGHLFCSDCLSILPENNCPICRVEIKNKIKIFL